MRKKFPLLFILILLLAACSPFSRQIIKESDEVLSIATVQHNPGQYTNRPVLWGGAIIETVNLKTGTQIKVMRTKLDYEKEPKDLHSGQGRFIIETKAFLDPYVYRKGRLVTAAGNLAGVINLKLGETIYPYPVIKAKQVHLWSEGYYYGPSQPYYWYDPFWSMHYPFWYGVPYYGNYPIP